MSEINEIIAVADQHTSSLQCPFCPEEPEPDFTTHPGSANHSGTLEKIMGDPSQLVPEQGAARPKEGQPHQQSPSTAQLKPTPIYTSPEDGPFSCEAHHLISGKQALEGHAFERWIVAGGTIEKDTGYSVNNCDNGLWCPSIPEKHKGGSWGNLGDFEDKYKIARKPMDAGLPQFHKSHHSIRDKDEQNEWHEKYDTWLKGLLTQMDDRMTGWSAKCKLCETGGKNEPPFQPSVRVNQVLDNLSRVARRNLLPPASRWKVFLSRYSLQYHKRVGPCTHGAETDLT
jgi:hypothetical protein